jgi:hypothetical protein
MKVLILADSLSLPRQLKEEIIRWEDTYFYKLKQHFRSDDFHLYGKGGVTIDELDHIMEYYKYMEPDVIILQCGIVDCAPRAFTKFELTVLGKLHLIKIFKQFAPLFRKIRRICYTDIKSFSDCIHNIKAKCPNSVHISVSILPADAAYEKKLPGISNQIEKYNKVLAGATSIIDTFQFPKSGIASDYHHLTKFGHQVIFGLLRDKIYEMAN